MLRRQVAGLSTSFQKVGKGPLLILLHGWANTWEAWLPLIPELSDKYTLIIPDLPGFGQSQGPAHGWSTHHYALWLREFLENILALYPSKELNLAGHSFGGKIAAYYTSQNFDPVLDKLILIDASGIPGIMTSKQRVLRLMTLALPPFLKRTISETLRSRIYKAFDADSDYLKANEAQRKTLKKVLTDNISSNLKFIKTPTLILWGRDDPATPLSAGKIFHQLIPNNEMKTYDAEHFPHHQHPEDVSKTILEFLQKTDGLEKTSQREKILGQGGISRQPLETLLAILQQAEYEWPRFESWLTHQISPTLIEPKKWTTKLIALRILVAATTPFATQKLSLWFWNSLLKIPQALFFSSVIWLAKLKLRMLQMSGLKVVAIAGSYGKTSTKYIMNHAYSGLVPVLMTPENINTPYGIARTILTDLKPSHKLFIAELGEYVPGDIMGLTQFLSPQVKILTPIGYAHLERFGTVDRLEKGLLELITTGKKVKTLISAQNQPLLKKHAVSDGFVLFGEKDISACQVSRAGTEFVVSGKSIFIPLLGKHNALNTLPTLMLAKTFNLDETQVASKLRTLPHIPHRLEPTLLEHNVFLLDNGYNSNPGSARESLAVLQEIDGIQKIAITPGFVELGVDQEKANMELGVELAKVCDFIGIVTGANEAALLAGLTKAKFNATHIVTGASELEVMNSLQPHIKPGAVILFENSITEVYKTVI